MSLKKKEPTLEKGSRINKYGDRLSLYLGDLPTVPKHVSKLASQWSRSDLKPYKTVMQHSVALLNSHGGRMYFGVNQQGIVTGCVIERDTLDFYQLVIDDVFGNIQPAVSREKFRVEFFGITKNGSLTALKAMCIKIEPGSKSEIYWDASAISAPKVYVRTRGIITGPMQPNEIGRLVLERYKGFLADGGRINTLVKTATTDNAGPGTAASSSSGASKATATTGPGTSAKRPHGEQEDSALTAKRTVTRLQAESSAPIRINRRSAKTVGKPSMIVISEEE